MSESRISVASLAEVNPRTERPKNPSREVSFIPMADVSENGRWTGRQTRYLRDVQVGYTAFQDEDVLFAKITPCMENGKGAMVKGLKGGLGYGSTEFHVLRAVSGRCEPEFLAQVMALPDLREKAVSFFTGSAGQRRVSAQFFEHYLVPSYTLSEQRRIADLLSAVDEQIEVNRAQISKLQGIRSGVVTEKLLAFTADAATVALGSLCEQVTSGSRGWASFYSDKGALFLRIGNLTRENPNLRFDDVVRVQVPAGGEGARTRLQEGDLLISITADLGIIGSVPPGLGDAYVSQHIALARLSDPAANPRWVAHVLSSPYGAGQIARLNDGGAKAGLNLPTIRALRVPLPPMDQQLRIVELLDSLDAQLFAEQARLEKLQLQKRGLMRKLLVPSP